MRRRALALGAAFLLIALMPGSALAKGLPNLNQWNLWQVGHSVGMGQVAQTFTPNKTGMLSAVSLYVTGTEVPATISIAIQNVDGSGVPDDNPPLAGGWGSIGAGVTGWITISLWSPVSVTAGTQYAIVASSEYYLDVWGSTDTYPGGQAFTADGSKWYASSDTADLAFQAFVDTVTTQLAWDKPSVVAGATTPLILTASMTFTNGPEAGAYSAILPTLPAWFNVTSVACSANIAPADCTYPMFTGVPTLLLLDGALNGTTLTATFTGTATPALASAGTTGTATGEACLVYPLAPNVVTGARPNAPGDPGCADGSAVVQVTAPVPTPTPTPSPTPFQSFEGATLAPTMAVTLPPTSAGAGHPADGSGSAIWLMPIGLLAFFGGAFVLVIRRRRLS